MINCFSRAKHSLKRVDFFPVHHSNSRRSLNKSCVTGQTPYQGHLQTYTTKSSSDFPQDGNPAPHPQALANAQDNKTQTKDWRGQRAIATKQEPPDLKDWTHEHRELGVKNVSDGADNFDGEDAMAGYARARLYLRTVKGSAKATQNPETVENGIKATYNPETVEDGARVTQNPEIIEDEARAMQNPEIVKDGVKMTQNHEMIGDEVGAYRQCDGFEDIDWNRTSWEEYCAHLDIAEVEVKRIMTDMTTSERQSAWYTWMIQSQRECPEQAILYLYVAIKYPWMHIPQQQQLDFLSIIAVRFLQSAKAPGALHVDAIHQLACSYMSIAASSERPIFFEQNIIHLIQEHCSPKRMKSFLRVLLRYKFPLSGETLLHFGKRFVEQDEDRLSFEVLRIAVNMGLDTSSPALQRSCTKLLLRAARSRNESETSSILDQTLELGIKPNDVLWTCMVLAEIELGHYDEAWKWYYVGKSEGLKPGRIIMSVLLKIAKQGLDEDALDKVIELATEEGILPYDLDLVFDILHAIYVINQSRPQYGPYRTFELCLSCYSRYCTIEPLRELGIPVPWSVDQDDPSLGPSPPSTMVLGMMLMIYVRSHATTSTILPLYHQYRNHVISKHPVIAPLANTDHIGNAFIKAFGSQSECLQYCSLVLKDMLAATPFGFLLSTKLKSTNPQDEGKPTVQTWNILLDCYNKHGYRGAADKVFNMMRSRGVSPDLATWNHILAGYARMQDVDNVIETLQEIKAAKKQPNQFTLQALRRLADKAAYQRSLEEISQSDEELLIS